MAEGLLARVFGSHEDGPEQEAEGALARADGFASALAAKLAGNDPGFARKIKEFLNGQSQLLPVRKKHLEEEPSRGRPVVQAVWSTNASLGALELHWQRALDKAQLSTCRPSPLLFVGCCPMPLVRADHAEAAAAMKRYKEVMS